jgi:protein SCO1/2
VPTRLPALALALGVAVGGPLAPAALALPRLGPAPNYALTTSLNARVWLTQLRPRVAVLTFGCTRCVECAATLTRLADTARGLGDTAGRRAFFVLVSVDPRRDTPAVLRAFGRERGLRAPAWLLLTGDPEEIEVVTRRYDVPVRKDGDRVTPRCLTALVDGRGQLRAAYDQTDLDRLAADLAAVLAEDRPR